MQNRRISKRPKGLTDEEGIEFARASRDAASLGYTLWHMCEEWNGRYHCRLADPNSNAPSMGDSISYGRSGDTPGGAIRAVLAAFGPTTDEHSFAKLIEEIRDTDPLRAPVILKMETVKRLQEAVERNISAVVGLPVHAEEDDDL